MRYTDEGNIRFVGNTRTSTSTQGVYRQEFDSGKWAVTLTNTEPGLGYLGYNVEALSYDFENNMLCTGNISTSCINVSDTIITHCLESCCGLCFECGCISNGPSEIRLYGRPNDNPDDGCLVVADRWLCYCTCDGCASIVIDSTGVKFSGPIKADSPYLYVDDYLIASCLYADTSYNCHYIYGIKKNGSNAFTDTGILDIGAVGAAVAVNGLCYVANDIGVMSIPNMTTSVTLNNVTTPVDSNGNIDLGTFTAEVGLDNNSSLVVSNCTYSTAPVQSVVIGYNTNIYDNITLTNSVLIGNAACATLSANQDVVAIGNNAVVCGQNTIAIGARSRANGFGATAIGSGSCADSGTFAIGESAKGIYFDKIYVSTLKNGPFNKSMVAIGNLVKQCNMYNMIYKLYICSCHTSICLSDAQCRFGVSGTGRVKTNSGYFADLDIGCQWVTISCDYAVWENVGTFYKGCTDTWQPPYSDVRYIFTEFCY